MTIYRSPMSLDEYLARGSERFEIIPGWEGASDPGGYRHDLLVETLSDNLKTFVKANSLGRILPKYTFVDPNGTSPIWETDTVVPDIAFVAGKRLEEYLAMSGIDLAMPVALVPDFAGEIVSPIDRTSETLGNAGHLLDLGVKVMWSINPQRQFVIVYTPDADEVVLIGEDLLTTDLLPGWSIVVRDLFADKFGV